MKLIVQVEPAHGPHGRLAEPNVRNILLREAGVIARDLVDARPSGTWAIEVTDDDDKAIARVRGGSL